MRQDPIPPAVADRLSAAARRLRDARRTALDRAAVEETEWEYAGRTWSWPAGEAMTYFRELAPGEREVLDGLVGELDDLDETGSADGSRADSGAEIVGIGTGRVAVAIPGAAREGESESADRGIEPAGGGIEPDDGDPLVAKLARYGPSAEMGDGRPQNRRERRIWSAVESHPFLPVLDDGPGGDWIAMPRADVPPDESVREAALERVRTALAPHRDRFHFDELKPENVGAYRGRYWIVDYGRPTGDPLFVDPPGESASSGTGPDASGQTDPDASGRAETASDANENPQDRSREN